jgi:hypothetical protein
VLDPGIDRITVAGYKSIAAEQSIEVRPLTLLAGANSSGKSSILQPVLLLKQTLEASYDPGALLLNGPNVRLTSFDQALSRCQREGKTEEFLVGASLDDGVTIATQFVRKVGKRISVSQMTYEEDEKRLQLREGMRTEELQPLLDGWKSLYLSIVQHGNLGLTTVRDYCFLEIVATSAEFAPMLAPILPGTDRLKRAIKRLIHVPGLRGNPERTYPATYVGAEFSGTFEAYTASILARWQADETVDRLEALNTDLAALGLTTRVRANPIDDTQVEIQVGRLPRTTKGSTVDFVNIADVGFGVSQALPVIVALHAAEPGQLVYIEQPELHLHPKAQHLLAGVLASAAQRGVRVVAETHSSLLLLGVQTLVAQGKLDPSLVKLHWFQRDPKDGSTRIHSADLDAEGAYGDWPLDFDDVTLHAEGAFLDAAEKLAATG